jgi:hypothetical protein
MNRIPASTGATGQNLKPGDYLYSCVVKHDGEKDKNELEIVKYTFMKYETGKKTIEIRDERFPSVPIQHQKPEGFFLTEMEALASMFEGVASVMEVLVAEVKKHPEMDVMKQYEWIKQ